MLSGWKAEAVDFRSPALAELSLSGAWPASVLLSDSRAGASGLRVAGPGFYAHSDHVFCIGHEVYVFIVFTRSLVLKCQSCHASIFSEPSHGRVFRSFHLPQRNRPTAPCPLAPLPLHPVPAASPHSPAPTRWPEASQSWWSQACLGWSLVTARATDARVHTCVCVRLCVCACGIHSRTSCFCLACAQEGL